MYYRVSQASYSPDQYDAILAFMESKRDELRALDGLDSGAFVQTGPGEGMMVAAYESEDTFNAVSETVNSILGEIAPLLKAPPTTSSGTAVWSL